MNISVKTASGSYDIILQRAALKNAGEILNLNRKVLIVTDSNVPQNYSKVIKDQATDAIITVIEQGEKSKNLDTWKLLLQKMTENNFTRTDAVAAVGGGVVGDIAGFAAACYMRGIDFYNIPTTLLSQVDSSIGGKTAVDFMGYKNLVGAFFPPKKVIIDPDTLKTLPERQLSNGLAESVKMSLTSDKNLFEIFEKETPFDEKILDLIIEKSLLIKKYVVENDEKESGLRKILNFGHTLAHAIESINGMEKYYHGECVSMGMLPMCSDNIKPRVKSVLQKLNLPTEINEKADLIISAARHDKKASGGNITIVTVDEIGKCNLKTIAFSEYENLIRKAAEK